MVEMSHIQQWLILCSFLSLSSFRFFYFLSGDAANCRSNNNSSNNCSSRFYHRWLLSCILHSRFSFSGFVTSVCRCCCRRRLLFQFSKHRIGGKSSFAIPKRADQNTLASMRKVDLRAKHHTSFGNVQHCRSWKRVAELFSHTLHIRAQDAPERTKLARLFLRLCASYWRDV